MNVTIRQVNKDSVSFLTYAPEDRIAFVLLLAHSAEEKIENLNNFTHDMIDESLALGGSFYLPYQLNFSGKQLLKAYPQLPQWLQLKEKWDPAHLFSNNLYAYIEKLLQPVSRSRG